MHPFLILLGFILIMLSTPVYDLVSDIVYYRTYSEAKARAIATMAYGALAATGVYLVTLAA